MKNLDYQERMVKAKIPSMKYRRERGDMIEVYKYTHGFYDTPPPFTLESGSVTRGHQLKIKKTRPNGNLRQNFFSVRIENDWNSLPAELVNTQTINGFKNGNDALWKNKLYCI